MNFKSNIIAHTFRNKYLKYTGGNYSSSSGNSSSVAEEKINKWFYEDEDGNLHSKLDFVGDLSVSALGVSDEGSGGTVTTIDIIDNLTSDRTDAALSANQGRVLNEKIEEVKQSIETGGTGEASWLNLRDKPELLTDSNIQKWDEQSHTHNNKTVLDGITEDNVTNWNVAVNQSHTHDNKTVLDAITQTKVNNWDDVYSDFNKVFEIQDEILKVKLNLVGEKSVSALGYSSGSGGTVTDVDIIDNLESDRTDAALSARQGKVLKQLIDEKSNVTSWDDLADKPTTISGYGITDAVTINTEQSISGQKTFSKVIYQGSSLANRRAISFVDTSNNAIFADVNGSSIIRGSNIRFQLVNGTDLVKISGSDVLINGNTSYHTGNLSWNNLQGKPTTWDWNNITNKPSTYTPSSHTHTKSQITDFPTTWSWSNITSKPTSLSGYGITDGVNSVTVTGSGNAVTSASVAGHTLTLTKGSTYLLSSQYTASDILTKLKTVDGAGSGLDADTIDGTDKSGLLTALSSSSSTNISITVGGTTKSISDLHATYSEKLLNKRTIWGQNFDGSSDVDGSIFINGNIFLYGDYMFLRYSQSVPYGIYFSPKSDGSFWINGHENNTYTKAFMVFDYASGNVGVGTSSPTQRLHVAGNILANGQITAQVSSDARLKDIIKPKKTYQQRLLQLGKVVDFQYNKAAKDRNKNGVDDNKHIGLIYQNVVNSDLSNFAIKEDDGFGTINYLSTDYINLIAGAVQELIKDNKKLKRELNKLKKIIEENELQ